MVKPSQSFFEIIYGTMTSYPEIVVVVVVSVVVIVVVVVVVYMIYDI